MEILILCGIYLVELLCYLILLQMLFDVRVKTKVWLIVGIALPIILGFLSVDISGKIFCVSISVVLVMLVSIEGSYIEKGIRLVLTLLLLECVNGIFTNPCEKLMILIGNNYMRDLNYLHFPPAGGGLESCGPSHCSAGRESTGRTGKRRDRAGQGCTYDDRERTQGRGAVATIMGLDRAIRNSGISTGSVYDERGILSL